MKIKLLSIIFFVFFIHVNAQIGFEEHIIVDNISSVGNNVGDPNNTINIGDIDGDNDNDILYSSYWTNELSWFENLDGKGSFGNKNVIDNLTDVKVACFVDLDLDGYLDVISGEKKLEGTSLYTGIIMME